MKAVLLAGGFGTRISEATQLVPKPMVEVGGYPILWHIMKLYSHYGINEFVICLGYKGMVIKNWFADYFINNCDVTIDLKNNSYEVHQNHAEDWKVTLVDTGLNTMTGGRIKKIQKYIGNESFLLTYGDGVSDVNIAEVIDNHREKGKLLTVTSYKPIGRFGALEIAPDGSVTSFTEKPAGEGVWINAGYFVCEPEVFNYIPDNDDSIVFERAPMEKLARDGEMSSYEHTGFWKPMDTMKDSHELNALWDKGSAPWKVW